MFQDDDIEIEDEIDANDLVIHQPGELVGIQLLTRKYVVEERSKSHITLYFSLIQMFFLAILLDTEGHPISEQMKR